MSKKAIFLDRDGTIIEDPGYLNHPDQVVLLDGVAEALVELRGMGYKLIVASNQSGVARGIITEKILGDIHDRLRQLLAEKGAYLDEIYYCPYHPDGVVPKYSKESELRKPNPGMLLAAAEDMNIDLSQSWSIGDSSRDIEAGMRAGCHTILLTYHSRYKTSYDGPIEAKPDYKSVNMKEAVNIIKKYHRTSSGEKVSTKPIVEYKPQLAPEPESKPARKPKIRQALKIRKKTASQTAQKSNQQQENHVEHDATPLGTEQMLNSILGQLKSMQRENMFGEFSIMRFIAGVIQIIVPFCLLVTVWLLMRPERQDSLVLISLGFAMVLQMMSLTFYIMSGRK